MSLDEFQAHFEDWNEEPWWDTRHVVHLLAVVCSLIANANFRKEGDKAYTEEDFLPRHKIQADVEPEAVPANFSDVMQFMKEMKGG